MVLGQLQLTITKVIEYIIDQNVIIARKIEKTKGPNGPLQDTRKKKLATVVDLLANIQNNLKCFTWTVTQIIVAI